jgi:tetratricopeptide (TPR) repeat protein
MNRIQQSKLRVFSLFLSLLFLIVAGCAKQAAQSRTSSGSMDTPEFHIQRGDDALLAKRYEEARASYRKAISLDANNSQALGGMAAASAYEASRPGVSKATRQSVLDEAEEQIKRALKTAKTNPDKARSHSFAIQVYLALRSPSTEWYEMAKDHFEDAIDLTPDDPTPYFFMGLAEAERLNYNQASVMFDKVLNLGKAYEAEANQEIKRMQEIRRALPGSKFGAKIANVSKITRADVAALFIAELRLDRLYQQTKNSMKGTAYQVPQSQQKMKLDPIQKYPDAVDISGHPLEDSIKEVILLGVKGLSPDPAHKFYPDQEFKRAEFAQLVQDLLIKITRDVSLSTRFIGEPSPFPDVNEDVWYYNATRTAVNRGLMAVNNKVTGEFDPLAPVSGADALLTIRTMKEILKEYLR